MPAALMVLAVLTKALDVAVGDEAGGEAEEGFMDVVSPFPADSQAAKPWSQEMIRSTTQRKAPRPVPRC
jgi:hypothetical protein